MTFEDLLRVLTTRSDKARNFNDATGLSTLHSGRNNLVDMIANVAPQMDADTTASEIIGAENPNLVNPRDAVRSLAEMIPNLRVPETGLEGIITAAQLAPYAAAGVKSAMKPTAVIPDYSKRLADEIPKATRPSIYKKEGMPPIEAEVLPDVIKPNPTMEGFNYWKDAPTIEQAMKSGDLTPDMIDTSYGHIYNIPIVEKPSPVVETLSSRVLPTPEARLALPAPNPSEIPDGMFRLLYPDGFPQTSPAMPNRPPIKLEEEMARLRMLNDKRIDYDMTRQDMFDRNTRMWERYKKIYGD